MDTLRFETGTDAGESPPLPFHLSPWTSLLLALLVACGADRGEAAQQADDATTASRAVTAAAPPVAPQRTPQPMIKGFFDHTAHWYRNHPPFRPEQNVPRTWSAEGGTASVVLYNDIPGAKGGGEGGARPSGDVRSRIAARDADIAAYLDDAEKNGSVRVFLQLPVELIDRWPAEANAMRPILADFVRKWRDRPALAGFYLYDEPELSHIPVQSLQGAASVVRQEAAAERKTIALSVAYGAIEGKRAVFNEYARASPAVFDVLLVNRYPIYRAYGRSSGKAADAAFATAKLGFGAEKARRAGLVDNEFANLADYYPMLEKAVAFPLDGRPVLASLQAYGLRDDCDGEDCKVLRENKGRRSPTWNELLYLYSSVWMSGLDGALLYSHYFALYDTALTKRIGNLEKLMPDVFANLPVQGPGVSVAGGRGGSPDGVHAAYVPDATGEPSYQLVVVYHRSARDPVTVQLDPKLRVVEVHERRFDAQGNEQAPVATRGETKNGVTVAFQVPAERSGVRIFELRHE